MKDFLKKDFPEMYMFLPVHGSFPSLTGCLNDDEFIGKVCLTIVYVFKCSNCAFYRKSLLGETGTPKCTRLRCLAVKTS